MIALYCRKNHNSSDGSLCPECDELLRYAYARLDRCPHMACKTSCRKCTTHCYAPAQRERIRKVMASIGPIMIFHHPVDAIRHIIDELNLF